MLKKSWSVPEDKVSHIYYDFLKVWIYWFFVSFLLLYIIIEFLFFPEYLTLYSILGFAALLVLFLTFYHFILWKLTHKSVGTVKYTLTEKGIKQHTQHKKHRLLHSVNLFRSWKDVKAVKFHDTKYLIDLLPRTITYAVLPKKVLFILANKNNYAGVKKLVKTYINNK